jgi:DNA-binding MurR/RpiR family transcriptional regulator
MQADATLENRVPFGARVHAAAVDLSPAEQRVARFFAAKKEVVLLASAAEIAQQAGASDATVVRTARSLGFENLSALREDLLSELTGAASPGRRLRRTLAATGDSATQALRHVIRIHEEALDTLKREDIEATFVRVIPILADASRRHVFGIGPSGALAQYAALQFNRIGLPSSPLSATGVGLADQLLFLNRSDAILMIAYAPLYREVSVVLEQARDLAVPVVLISDSLGPLVADAVREVLPVPRGRADHLAMHGGTMVLIEALTTALAGRRPQEALESLERLNRLRATIDKSWLKRGVKRARRSPAPDIRS